MDFLDIPGLSLTLLRNPAGWAGTQPTGCLSAPARTFAAPAPWGWLGGFAMQGVRRTPLVPFDAGALPHLSPLSILLIAASRLSLLLFFCSGGENYRAVSPT